MFAVSNIIRHSIRPLARQQLRICQRSLHFVEKLPFAIDAFEPAVPSEQFNVHVGYEVDTCRRLNALIEGTKYELNSLEDTVKNAGQDAADGAIFALACEVWNHRQFFKCITPVHELHTPSDFIHEQMNIHFGGLDKFKKLMYSNVNGIIGSGWVWLVANEGQLEIEAYPAMGSPAEMVCDTYHAVLGFDCWEHAYLFAFSSRKYAGQPEAVKSVKTLKPPGTRKKMSTLEYSVKMTCGGCSKAVKALVSKVDGVESVEADHETQKVVVTGSMEQDKVTEAIKKTGKEIISMPS